MSKESFIRGFCKAAEAHGVDPKALAKYAAGYSGVAAVGPTANEEMRRIEQRRREQPFWDEKDKAVLDELAKSEQVSNPSFRDYINLMSINKDRLAEAAKGLTLGDYLENLEKVDPEFYQALAASSSRKDGGNEMGEHWGKPLDRNLVGNGLDYHRAHSDMFHPESEDIDGAKKRMFSANYANITNLLDQVGQKTGNPVWDVQKRRPTPYGYGMPAKDSAPAPAAKPVPVAKPAPAGKPA